MMGQHVDMFVGIPMARHRAHSKRGTYPTPDLINLDTPVWVEREGQVDSLAVIVASLGNDLYLARADGEAFQVTDTGRDLYLFAELLPVVAAAPTPWANSWLTADEAKASRNQ